MNDKLIGMRNERGRSLKPFMRSTPSKLAVCVSLICVDRSGIMRQNGFDPTKTLYVIVPVWSIMALPSWRNAVCSPPPLKKVLRTPRLVYVFLKSRRKRKWKGAYTRFFRALQRGTRIAKTWVNHCFNFAALTRVLYQNQNRNQN